MTDQDHVEDVHQLAPLYALGGLTPAEISAFEQHLTECEECARELKAYTEVTAAIGQASPATPRPELRNTLMERVRKTPREPGIVLQAAGVLVSRPEELPWRPVATGIELKLLFHDARRQYNTCLVHMDAGARYPSHRHAGVEELFLLSGDLHLGDDVMYAGDYCRAESESIHGEIFTQGGCTFLVMSSTNDEMLSSSPA